MATRESLLHDFEAFLSFIPLERYRAELLPIKTVEQDLPRELNPLPDIYQVYWTEESRAFPTYDAFFDRWWTDHLEPLDRFISQYFWGCSHVYNTNSHRLSGPYLPPPPILDTIAPHANGCPPPHGPKAQPATRFRSIDSAAHSA